ncbi:RDD family protein [Cognatishimia sp. WU-CL00825]|uniref:RDD family protein n=1 Tax=Cognatishimia sp. WU-CL00825 TaxID=3127658 RepID=UPI0031060176
MNTRSYALPDPQTQPEFYADVPTKRLLAWFADMVLIGIICFAISVVTLFVGFFFWFLLTMVVGFIYRVVTLANGSATWGMRFFGIEMRTQDGARFELGHAFLHTLGYSVSVSFPVLQIISIVMMLTTARSQGLTDHVMGTVAINRAARF